MKNILKYMLGLVIFFGCIDGVSAKEVATCKYSYKSIDNKNYTFSYVVTDTGLTSKTGSLNDYTVRYDSDFDKEYFSKTYSNSKLSAKCPTINVCFEQSYNQIDVRLYSYTCSAGESSTAYEGNMTAAEGEVQVADKSKTYCSTTRPMRNESYNVTISFGLDENGAKIFSVFKSGTKEGGIVDPEGNNAINVDGHVFFINKEDIGKYYSDSCSKTTKMFLKCTGGETNNITIQTTKPEDTENCAYAVTKTEDDDGLDYQEPEGHSSWNATDNNTLKFAKKIYDIIKILIPVLVIVLSIVDFLKVLLISDEKNYKASFSKFIKRIILGIVFFAVPALIALLLSLSGLSDSGILNVFA